MITTRSDGEGQADVAATIASTAGTDPLLQALAPPPVSVTTSGSLAVVRGPRTHGNGVALRRLASNTLLSMFGQGVTWLSTLILTMAYGRFLGDLHLGQLYLAITFVGLIGFPLEFGFNQQLIRDVAQVPGRATRYLWSTLILKLGLWFVLYCGMMGVAWLLRYDGGERAIVAVCGLTLLLTGVSSTFASLHYAVQRAVFPVLGNIIEKGLGAAAGVLLLAHGYGVLTMAFILLAAAGCNAVWQAGWFFRLTGVHFALDFTHVRALVVAGLPFLIYGVLGVIYYRIDTVLLSLMTSTVVVGWYGAAYRLFDTLCFLPNVVIMAILYPVFSRYSVTSQQNLKIAVEKTLSYLMFIAIPIATGLIFASTAIIGFLYHNPQFTNTVPALEALAPGLVFLYANSVVGSVLMSTKREKRVTAMAGVALVFNLAVNLLLIPRMEHVGAAIATSATELLLLCLGVAMLPREFVPWRSLRTVGKSLVAGVAMAGAILAVDRSSLLVILPVAAVVYFGLSAALGTIPRDDFRALYVAFRRKSQRADDVPVPTPAAPEGGDGARQSGATPASRAPRTGPWQRPPSRPRGVFGRIRAAAAGTIRYSTSHLIANVPSQTIRLAWYRHVLGWYVAPSVSILMGQRVQMAGIRTTGRRVSIDRGTVINQGCYISTIGGLVIGQNVTIAEGVWLITGARGANDPVFRGRHRPIVIDDNAWIGVRATILGGVTIGSGAVVLPGAVVTSDVPDGAVVGGVPAQVTGDHVPLEHAYAAAPRPAFD